MRLVPKIWTEHHTRRIYHLSMLGLFSVALLLSGILSFIAYKGAKGDVTQSVDLSVTVPAINSGPPTVIVGSGSPPPSPVPAPPPTPNPPPNPGPTPGVPKITIIADTNKIDAQKHPLFNGYFPGFHGQSDIPNARIFIIISGRHFISSVAYADALGNWHWKSQEAVSPGMHTINVSAEDQNDARISASAAMDFMVAVSGGVPESTPPGSGNATENYFSLGLVIPSKYKIISPGAELLANISLFNWDTQADKHPYIGYVIKDMDNNVILDTKEQITVSAPAVYYLKSFYVADMIKPGIYTLTARIENSSGVASSYDTFQISGAPAINLGIGTVDYTVVFQCLVGLVFLFLVIMYFEYDRVILLSKLIKRVGDSDLKGSLK